jgi:hypothetical protein
VGDRASSDILSKKPREAQTAKMHRKKHFIFAHGNGPLVGA